MLGSTFFNYTQMCYIVNAGFARVLLSAAGAPDGHPHSSSRFSDAENNLGGLFRQIKGKKLVRRTSEWL